VTVAKSGNGPLTAGQTASYTITVSNIGAGAATNVVVTDTLPSGTWTVSAPPNAGCPATASGTMTCTFTGSLNPFAAGGSVIITISRATTTSDCGTLVNNVSVSASNEPTSAAGNNTASASIIVNCPPPANPGKMTGGGQFICNSGSCTGKVSFGFNARGTAGGIDASGHFNSVILNTNQQINGPVILIVSVILNPDGTTQQMTFRVQDSKSSCIYEVTTKDVAEPGAGKDTISVVLASGVNCSPSETSAAGTTLTAGNIQGHKAQP
jgi:uncharacterized repeat protein (TIGR01451 family)